jgi:hypothetical protein
MLIGIEKLQVAFIRLNPSSSIGMDWKELRRLPSGGDRRKLHRPSEWSFVVFR